MKIIDLFNKMFPDPSGKRATKGTSNPKYFEDSLRGKIEKRRKKRFDLQIESLHKSNSDYLRDEKGNIKETFEQKRRRESQNLGLIALKETRKKEPFTLLEESNYRFSESLKKDRDKIAEGKKKNKELAAERWIRLNYLNKDKKTQGAQWKSLEPWIKYLKQMPIKDSNFSRIVLGTVLNHTKFWMDIENGIFDKQGRRKNSKNRLEFPIFDPDITPLVLAKIREISFFVFGLGIPGVDVETSLTNSLEQDYGNGEEIAKAFIAGDIRKVYFLIKEHIELSQFDYEQVVGVVEKKWLPVSSLKECKNDTEKGKAISQVVQTTKNSRGFCIKGYQTAKEYLEEGDLYFYEVHYLVDINKGKKDNDGNDLEPNIKEIRVPEIAIHVKRFFINGREILKINENEVHGNGPNQGIRPEFLPVARKWIAESDFINKEEFEVKFADAEMFENVKKKIENLENGGPDLDARELKFLYKVYRPVTFFELNMYAIDEVENLRFKRIEIILTKKYDGGFYDEGDRKKVEKKDYATMFGCNKEEILNLGRPAKRTDFLQNPKPKVAVGIVSLTDQDLNLLSETEEITGELFIRCKFGSEGFNERIKLLAKLKKVNGIVLNDEDKVRLLSYGYNKFPSTHNGIDPRLMRIFY